MKKALLGFALALGLITAPVAGAEPFDPFDIINPSETDTTPCMLIVPGKWLCPEGFKPPVRGNA